MKYGVEPDEGGQHRLVPKDFIIAFSLVVFCVAVFSLSNVGRIDIIDGQWRFEVAYNLFNDGVSEVFDPFLKSRAAEGLNGASYSRYGISSAIVALPWMALAQWLVPDNRDFAQFVFTFVSPVFGGLLLGAVYLGYRYLEISSRRAVAWTLVLGLTTIMFPLSCSTFDQVQHAFFLYIAVAFTYHASKTSSPRSAIVGMAAFAILVGYQMAFFVLWPSLLWIAGLRSLSGFSRQTREVPVIRVYWLGGLSVLLLLFLFNVLRFGTLGVPPGVGHPPIFGNPVLGLLLLTVSPGKGLLWYSPSVVFCFLGWMGFKQAHPVLAKGILAMILTWLLLISSLSFPGGEWCWGPRYWVPILPLLFMSTPFVVNYGKAYRVGRIMILAGGLVVQVLAVSVETHRFFYERNLLPFFWYDNYGFYYRESALASRLTELKSIRLGHKLSEYPSFRPGPYPESLTYTITGPKLEERSHIKSWMKGQAVFWLPRPWPLWSLSIEDWQIAKYSRITTSWLLGFMALGFLSIFIFLSVPFSSKAKSIDRYVR